MCGRYYVEISDSELRDIADTAQQKVKSAYRDITLKTNGEIYPADMVSVIASDEVLPMQWGFSFRGNKLLINARFETFTEKATFKNCEKCIIPASGYFEWKRDTNPKVKYAFSREDTPLYLAGLYRTEKDKPLPCFVILTREAAGVAAEIHHRMPVILEKNKIPEWFSGDFDTDSAVTDINCIEADLPSGQISFDF